MKTGIVLLAVITFALTGCTVGHGLRERSRCISTTLQFHAECLFPKTSFQMIKVGDDMVFWPQDAPPSSSLDPKARYRLCILEVGSYRSHMQRGKISWSPELVQVSRNGRVLYDASICRVHRVKMTRQTVTISYGFPDTKSPFWVAMHSGFPNYGFAAGGCCVDEDEKYGRAWVCPVCAANEHQWEKEHPGR